LNGECKVLNRAVATKQLTIIQSADLQPTIDLRNRPTTRHALLLPHQRQILKNWFPTVKPYSGKQIGRLSSLAKALARVPLACMYGWLNCGIFPLVLRELHKLRKEGFLLRDRYEREITENGIYCV
jgi:hypothetical protein